jgi:hypothetical protein
MLRAAIKRIFHVTSIGSLRARFGAGPQNLHFFSGFCNKEGEIFAKSVYGQPSEAKVAIEALPVARPKLIRGGRKGLFNFILIKHSMSTRLE